MRLTLPARWPASAMRMSIALAAAAAACLTLSAFRLAAQEGGRDINPAFLDELREKSEGGDADASFALGTIYYLGHEALPKDAVKAVEYLEKAASKGHVMAMSFLGEIYESGSGVPRDERKAVRYFTRAADKGDAEAALALGRLYFFGTDTLKADKKKSFRYYTLAAGSNLPEAQLMLGGMYETGEGTAKDNAKSWQYMLLAADNPDDDGRGAMAAGDVYVSGRNPDVPQNIELGRQYYRRAAAKNVPEAKERLALLDRSDSAK